MLNRKVLVEEYRTGKSLKVLADKYGTTPSRIRDILKREGVELRGVSGQLLFSSGGWRKLSRINNCKTRLVSIPSQLLVEAGLNPNKELFGKWKVKRRKLLLLIKEG